MGAIVTVFFVGLKYVNILKTDGGVEFGNVNGGTTDGEGIGNMTGDASGSQTRYKLVGIDASLNTNPPNNFEEENAPDWPNDLSGTVVELGLCWKVTDDPENDKATVSDLYKNILYDGSKNGTNAYN